MPGKSKNNKNLPLVSIVIANLNGRHHLECCLPSLKRTRYSNIELIVVDNGSHDDSLSYISQVFPEAIIIKNRENLGFAEANNQGIKRSQGKYILLLNNDTKVTEGFLFPLVESLENDSNLGAVQSKIYLMNKDGVLDATGAFFTRTGFLSHEGIWEKDLGQYDQKRYIFSAKGACVLLRHSSLKEVGLLDNDFFAYFEETDLFWRMWLAGYKVKFIPKSVIYHAMGATSSKLRTEFIEFHSFKNRLASLYKNLGIVSLLYIYPTNFVITLFIGLLFGITGKFRRSSGIWKAIGWNFKNHKILNLKRAHVQKGIRRVSDKELFPVIMRSSSFAKTLHSLKGYLAIKRK